MTKAYAERLCANAQSLYLWANVGVKGGVFGLTMRLRIRDKEVDSMGNGYNGKIKNTGSQVVKAPNNQGASAQGNVVHRGTDLRTGKGKK